MHRIGYVAIVMIMLVTRALPQTADVSKTQFGSLEFSEKDALTFQGKPLDPPIQGGGGSYLSEPYRMGAKDVVLVTKPGGTACPVKYYFVTVTKDGAKATRSIGTCNEATSTERKGNSITLTMKGFLGPYEPEDKRRKAFAEDHVFVFRDGAVTDNGKPVR